MSDFVNFNTPMATITMREVKSGGRQIPLIAPPTFKRRSTPRGTSTSAPVCTW